jgi:protease-4
MFNARQIGDGAVVCVRWGLCILAAWAAGCSAPSFLVTPVSSSHELHEETVENAKGWTSAKIAVIGVEGMLADSRSSGLFQANENPLSLFVQQLDKAAEDPDVKAVVLRINSPGGTVTCSDTMYQLVQRFRKKTGKVVIASTQEVAASGAYYVCCACDKIVAQPTSLVGSIGVIFERVDVSTGLGKIGVSVDAIHSGTLKEMGSPFKHSSSLENKIMEQMVDDYFRGFEQVVKSNRPVKEEPLSAEASLSGDYAGIYSGRVFSGTKAVELGLADSTGLLSDAVDLARQMSHAPDARAVLYERPYGYGGSIYARSTTPPPQQNVLQLSLPDSQELLPTGFYYLWQP